jgi:hypothetical protein
MVFLVIITLINEQFGFLINIKHYLKTNSGWHIQRTRQWVVDTTLFEQFWKRPEILFQVVRHVYMVAQQPSSDEIFFFLLLPLFPLFALSFTPAFPKIKCVLSVCTCINFGPYFVLLFVLLLMLFKLILFFNFSLKIRFHLIFLSNLVILLLISIIFVFFIIFLIYFIFQFHPYLFYFI